MAGFITDFVIIAVLIIGITATMGVLTNGIGTKIIGRKNRNLFVEKSNRMQTGWKQVGGFKK